jgi:hypothetical protein
MMFKVLYSKLERLVHGYSAEIIAVLDNKMRTIGAKCNDLITMARGDYLTFVDDDDDVSVDYVDKIMESVEDAVRMPQPPEVINYQVSCVVESREGVITRGVVLPSIHHPNEEFHEGTVLRKPLQTSVWRSDLAKSAKWLEANYEADSHWARQLWPKIKSEVNLPTILYYYRHSAKTTEAS